MSRGAGVKRMWGSKVVQSSPGYHVPVPAACDSVHMKGGSRQGRCWRAEARVHNPAQEDRSLCPLLHPKLTRLPTVASPISASSPSSLASSCPQHSLEWIAKKADATSCHYSLWGSAFMGETEVEIGGGCAQSSLLSDQGKDFVVLSALRLQRDWG